MSDYGLGYEMDRFGEIKEPPERKNDKSSLWVILIAVCIIAAIVFLVVHWVSSHKPEKAYLKGYDEAPFSELIEEALEESEFDSSFHTSFSDGWDENGPSEHKLKKGENAVTCRVRATGLANVDIYLAYDVKEKELRIMGAYGKGHYSSEERHYSKRNATECIESLLDYEDIWWLYY